MTNDPDKVFEAVRSKLSPEIAHVISAEFFVEVLAQNTDKSVALEAACGALDVAMDEVVFFGDGNNDVEGLRAAGLGVAMCNGTDAARAAGDVHTAKTNTQEGVRRYLEGLERNGDGYFRHPLQRHP